MAVDAGEALSGADPGELRRLAELLDAGLLGPPAGALTLREHVPAERAAAVADYLGELARDGMTGRHMAVAVRAYAAGVEEAAGRVREPEVVASGPDAAGDVRDTGVVVRQLFAKAKRRVLAVGFAVHQGKAVFEVLGKRLDEEHVLEATLCLDVRRRYGDTTVGDDLVRRFALAFRRDQWPGVRAPAVYYDPRSLAADGGTESAMHAKCVVVDGGEALVTSANFTEAAQQRNIELGLLVQSRAVAGRIERHFRTLIASGRLARLPLA